MIVLILATAVAKIFKSWRDAVRIGLVVMLFFTAAAHFAPAMKHDLAAMIPPPFTGNLAIIYLTGVLEIAGAVGLLIPRFRRPAAICLALLMLAMFPANVYAALNGVTLRGAPATELWLRTPMQILWIALLWWSSIRRASTRESEPLPSPA
ncbi:MAG TPA: MauE/DoxX family redox-associated membrane protein [Thermoanaerobaculia bacterium]|nr:MauE/DoxX family redox-associated membrane protein [Thermoanaerobaculia bacterium]